MDLRKGIASFAFSANYAALEEIPIFYLYICEMIDVILKKGKEKAAMLRHPWIFSGAIDKIKGNPENGEVVTLRSAAKEFLAYAYYNDQSRVALRLLEWDENTTINKSWYREKLKAAIASRDHEAPLNC